MEFNLMGTEVHNPTNIRLSDNGDDTFEIWFDALYREQDNPNPHLFAGTFHLYRVQIPGLLSSTLLTNDEGKFYEVKSDIQHIEVSERSKLI